jgi:Family of unknown function (DUF6049)
MLVFGTGLCTGFVPGHARAETPEAIDQTSDLGRGGTPPPVLPGVDLQVVDQSMAVASDGAVNFVVALTGPVPDGYDLVVIAYPKVETRTAAQAVINGARNPTVSVVNLGPPAAIARDAAGQLTFSIAITRDSDPTRLLLNGPGLFPLGVILRDNKGIAKNEQLTFVERLPEPGSAPLTPLRVGLAVEIDGAPSLQPSGVAMMTDEVSAQFDALIALLTATPWEVDIAIRPELLDGLALSEDPEDQRRLEALASAVVDRHRVLTRPYVTLDPSFAAGNGLTGVFTEQLRRGDETVRTRLGVVADRSVWLINSGIDAPGIELLRNLGVQSFIVGDDLVTGDDGAFPGTEGALGTLTGFDDELPVMMAEPALRTASVTTDRILVGPARSRLVTADAFAIGHLADSSGTQPGLLIVDRDLTTDDVAEFGELAKDLAANPRVTFIAPSDLVRDMLRRSAPGDRVPLTLSEANITSSFEIGELLIRLRTGIDTTASMLPVNTTSVERWNSLLGVVVSQSLSADDRQFYVSQLDGEIGEVREAVKFPESPSFNLGGEATTIPLALESSSTAPLQVIVRLTSPNNKVEFENNDIPVTINGRTEFFVPVRVRSSGKTSVIVQVLTPGGPDDGRVLIGPTRLALSTSVLSGIGQLVTWGFLGILLLWWVHHARKTRRHRRDALAYATSTHPATTLESS